MWSNTAKMLQEICTSNSVRPSWLPSLVCLFICLFICLFVFELNLKLINSYCTTPSTHTHTHTHTHTLTHTQHTHTHSHTLSGRSLVMTVTSTSLPPKRPSSHQRWRSCPGWSIGPGPRRQRHPMKYYSPSYSSASEIRWVSLCVCCRAIHIISRLVHSK